MPKEKSAGLGPPYRIGALRSRLVSKLTGLSKRQLGYWHETGLITAQIEPGARGYPRLYSWTDCLRLRAAAKFSAAGVPTHSIRTAVEYLERHTPDWYLLPLRAEGQHVIAHVRSTHFEIAADLGGQVSLFEALEEIYEEGPLGAMHDFHDAVDMDPRVRAGSPVVATTRIETAFVSGLIDLGYEPENIAHLYALPLQQIHRAIEFERLVA